MPSQFLGYGILDFFGVKKTISELNPLRSPRSPIQTLPKTLVVGWKVPLHSHELQLPPRLDWPICDGCWKSIGQRGGTEGPTINDVHLLPVIDACCD